MHTKLLIVVGIILGIVLAVTAGKKQLNTGEISESQIQTNYKDATYVIEDRPVTLKNGVAEVEAAPGSMAKEITKYFGNEATGDLNGDGTADVAFILTQNPGGTGTFYYIVAALKTESGYQGTNGIFLGDRIAPQTTEIREGKIIANFADRRPTDPFSAEPSVGVSKYIIVQNGALAEVQ